MNEHRLGVGVVFLFVALVFVYYATSKTTDKGIPIPELETEAQFNGLGLNSEFDLRYNPGSMLSSHPVNHNWDPMGDGDSTSPSKVTTRVRYPIISGGNVSTLIHRGWSGFQNSSPNKEWFYAPPEAAVL